MKREMWLIWKEPMSRRRYKVGVLTYNGEYEFKYVNPELDDAVRVGFDFFPGFDDFHKVYKSENLFANIETRLPNPSRPDYLEILNVYGLEKNSEKMDILKATRGRLITDNYEFVSAFDKSKIEFDVAGTRHSTDVKKCMKCISINDTLELLLDNSNEYDDYAIKVILNKDDKKYHLGYVPRYYSSYLTNLLDNDVEYSAMVKSINFESEISDEDVTVLVKLIFK